MSISLRWLAAAAALIAVGGIAAIGLVDGGGASPGTKSSPASAAVSPQDLAAQLEANDDAMRQAIDSWRAAQDPPTTQPPQDVLASARYLQNTVRFLAAHPNLVAATLRLLPSEPASEVGELVAAARKLRKLSGGKRRRLRVGLPPPLAALLSHYREARQRHGVAPHYLAVIHLVETKFGRVKSKSTAGARGPMQFIPSTWRIYGRDGNIHDPHDAILAAANLLRHNGAPRSYSRALFAYNPSRLYVNAVQRYAKVIARDSYALYFLYCWGP